MFFLKLFLKPRPPTCACGAPAADDESYFCSSACAHNDSFRTLSKVGTHSHYRDTVQRRESDRIPPKNPVSAPRPSAHVPPPVHPLQATPPPAPFGIYIPLDGRYLPPIASDPFAADPCPSVQGKTSPRPRTGSLPKRAMRPPHGHRHKCKGHGPQATGGPAPSPAPIPPSSRPGLKNSPCSPHSAALRRSRSAWVAPRRPASDRRRATPISKATRRPVTMTVSSSRDAGAGLKGWERARVCG